MLRVFVTNPAQNFETSCSSGPLEFGRLDVPSCPGAKRVVLDDAFASRDQLRLEQVAAGTVRLTNLSASRSIKSADGSLLKPGDSIELRQPFISLTIGQTELQVETDTTAEVYRTIATPVVGNKQQDLVQKPLAGNGVPDATTLASWMESLVAIHRSAAGSAEFYEETARAIVDLIGLDDGLVLLVNDDQWEIESAVSREIDREPHFSRHIVRQAVEMRRTYYQGSESVGSDTSESLAAVSLAAAAPIFDAPGEEVIGVLYGARRLQSRRAVETISELEAQMLQVLAAAVSVGIARKEKEAELVKQQHQFEQFFSPQLAQQLQRDPALLEGRERALTIMFADIRSFTSHATRLDPRETCAFVRDVLGCISPVIIDHGGVIVEYLGDGLLAIWNAPKDQNDHASLACRAALDIQIAIANLSHQWTGRLSTSLRVGIGLNSGMALVGNTGTEYKFQYGPLGHSVNLASRVEGATKQLGVPAIITAGTRDLIGEEFATRRLCKARFPGIDEPVDLYQIGRDADASWSPKRDAYEEALTQFEAGNWDDCWAKTQQILAENLDAPDEPTRILSQRARACMDEAADAFDPVYTLTK